MIRMAGEKRDFDAVATVWDENPQRVKLAGDICRALKETIRLTPAMDVLDVGCGTGLLTLQLQPQVRSITGIDSSEGMLGMLKAKVRDNGLANVTTRRVDLENREEWEGTYDLVVSSMTLHHIRNLSLLFDHVVSVVRPKGFLCIADLDKDYGKFHDSNEGVFHSGFDRAVLQKEFEKAGFCKVRNRTAAIIPKPDSRGEMQYFTVFIMTGEKREDSRVAYAGQIF
jgi:ubiquinone/menaquinone biosynthesis C-methylase UbiE